MAGLVRPSIRHLRSSTARRIPISSLRARVDNFGTRRRIGAWLRRRRAFGLLSWLRPSCRLRVSSTYCAIASFSQNLNLGRFASGMGCLTTDRMSARCASVSEARSADQRALPWRWYKSISVRFISCLSGPQFCHACRARTQHQETQFCTTSNITFWRIFVCNDIMRAATL